MVAGHDIPDINRTIRIIMEPTITLFSIIMLLGSAHGLFLALALVNTKGGNRAAHFYLALLTLAFAIDLGHEFLYQTGYLLQLIILAYIDPLINLLYGPLIYSYVRVLTDERDYKLQGVRWLHYLPVVMGISLCVLLPDLSPEQFSKLFYEDMPASKREDGMVLSVIGAIATSSVVSLGIYLVLSIARLLRHARSIRQQFSSIERITLNWLRNLLIAVSALYLILLFDGFLSQFFGLDEGVNRFLYLVIVAVIYTMGYLGLRQPVIFTQTVPEVESVITTPEPPLYNDKNSNQALVTHTKYKTSSLDADMSSVLLSELQAYMVAEHPHLDSKLTLPQLAKRMGISPNYLSQVINEQCEKNFFDFINDYRVEEAKQLLADSTKANLSIMHIAYEAGFNSKSAFYSAFKKHVGMTPSKYRMSANSVLNPPG